MRLTPRPLPDGGTISIIAPSSRGIPDISGIETLEALGFKVSLHPQNQMMMHQSAGSARDRAAAIMDAFTDTSVDAVMAARGGNRVMHALPYLDFATIAANPKPLIGFSDGTALLNAVYARTGLITYHGPTLSRLAKGQPHEQAQMVECLQGRPGRLEWPAARTRRGGLARGPLIGGNLSVFTALVGTPYMPKCDGAILFIEDIGEQLSRYDRMLAQLRLAGILPALAGIIVGRMLIEGDSSVTPFGFSLEDIVAEHVAELDIPVVMDAPFGHSGPLCTLPTGGMAVLDADARTLTLE